jgi:hypothetical protein
MFMSGCAKKEEPEPETKMEEMEEAPVDTVAVPEDTIETPEGE